MTDSRPLRDLALARSTTDRVAEHRSDEAWLAAAWADPSTRVVRVHSGRCDVTDAGLVAVSPYVTDAERYLLGVDRDSPGDAPVAWFAVHADEDDPAWRRAAGAAAVRRAGPAHPAGLREVVALLPDRDAGLMVHAVALANWHETHRFCPRCGAPTVLAAAGAERRCTVDGSAHFPRTDPAVIVAVTDPDDRVLLGRQEAWPPLRFSTLAGFVEPGESAEQAVVREVAEESGVEVAEVRYLGSQPWPFPSSLMLGFAARSRSGTAPVPDGDELAEVAWFSRADVARGVADGTLRLPPGVSIARRLVEHWYGGPLPDEPGGSAWR